MVKSALIIAGVGRENAFAPIKEHDLPVTDKEIPHEYYGWWRVIETSQWGSDDIDIIGTALISLTGCDDRLRMFVLLAHVNCKPTKTGVSFTWRGAWE